MAAAHSYPQPDSQRTGSSSLGLMNGSIKSLARLGSSPSRNSPTSYHLRNSSSASSLSLAPDIITSTAHKDMTFLQSAAGARYILSVSTYVPVYVVTCDTPGNVSAPMPLSQLSYCMLQCLRAFHLQEHRQVTPNA